MIRVLFCVLLVAGCGPLNSGSPAKKAINGLVSMVRGEEAPETPLITEELAQADEFLFVTIRRLGAVIPMSLAQRNGAVDTWIAPTGATVALENDILVATRGLGFDVAGIDPTGTSAAIAAGGGASQRRHGFLNARDQIELALMDCVVTKVGREVVELAAGPAELTKFEESCEGRQLVFKNEYWTNDEGNIIRSIQVLSPELGFLLLERA